jgi:WD40 repeat protein
VWDLAGASSSFACASPFLHTIRYSQDGRQLVLCRPGRFGNARILDATTGRPVGSLAIQGDEFLDADLSPDGRRLLTGSGDQTVRIWDAATGKLLLPPLQTDMPVYSAFFAAGGDRVVAKSGLLGNQQKYEVRLWDAATGRLLLQFPQPSVIASHLELALSPDGKWLAVAARLKVRIWDVTTGQPVTPEMDHPYWVQSPAFSPDASRLATCCGDQVVRVWDLPARKERLQIPHRTHVLETVFSPDGGRLATGDRQGNVRVHDALTGKPASPVVRMS